MAPMNPYRASARAPRAPGDAWCDWLRGRATSKHPAGVLGLREAIRARFDCDCRWLEGAEISEVVGSIAWTGDVHVFELLGGRRRVSAWHHVAGVWSSDVSTVLQLPPDDSPDRAVRNWLRQLASL
jgi:hypothetical protein